jgi:hypothetical protein
VTGDLQLEPTCKGPAIPEPGERLEHAEEALAAAETLAL